MNTALKKEPTLFQQDCVGFKKQTEDEKDISTFFWRFRKSTVSVSASKNTRN